MDIIKNLTDFFMNESKEYSLSEKSELARALFDSITDRLLQEENTDKEQIVSQNAVVEIIDQNDGKLYRRYLEIGYDENDNGLRLSGETLGGEPAQIVFLSGKAIEKLAELKGQGQEEPKCNHD